MPAQRPVSSRGQRWIANAAIASVALMASFLTLEFAVRIIEKVPVFSSLNFVALRFDNVRKDTGVKIEFDERVGWVQGGNIRWADPDFGEYTTGQFGARMSGDLIVPLQQNAIVAIGDSFLAGSEVSNAESWPSYLEKLVGIQVINLGVGGYGLDQSVLRAEQMLPILKPRIILVQTRFEFGVLLLSRMSVYGGAPKPFFRISDGKLSLNNVPVPRLASRGNDIGILRSVFGHSYLVDFTMRRLDLLQWWIGSAAPNRYAISTDDALSVSCLLMHRIGNLVKMQESRGAVVVQYSGSEVMKSQIPWRGDLLRIAECARNANVEFVDTLDEMRRVYNRDGIDEFKKLWVMHEGGRVFGHMSARGNELIAGIVKQRLFPDAMPAGDQKSK